jgi:Reverse transcriptase (RNA-dependent DNA polymerase)
MFSKADHSLFCKIDNHTITIILVYVYDIIVLGNNLEEIKEVKRKLKENFDIKYLWLLRYFLGIKIAHYPKSLFISYKKYFRFIKRNR